MLEYTNCFDSYIVCYKFWNCKFVSYFNHFIKDAYNSSPFSYIKILFLLRVNGNSQVK